MPTYFSLYANLVTKIIDLGSYLESIDCQYMLAIGLVSDKLYKMYVFNFMF